MNQRTTCLTVNEWLRQNKTKDLLHWLSKWSQMCFEEYYFLYHIYPAGIQAYAMSCNWNLRNAIQGRIEILCAV